ncbi:beta-1,3-galactosyltransferase 1 isoform X1 [Ixodes scapularis]
MSALQLRHNQRQRRASTVLATDVMAARGLHRWPSKLGLYLLFASCVLVFFLFKSYRPTKLNSSEHSTLAHNFVDSLVEEEQDYARSAAENPHVYPFIIDASHVCNSFENVPTLIVFVTSAPAHKSEREAIRNTWGLHSYLNHRSTKVLFLLGRSSKDTEIKAESQVHNDIIQGDFVDSYDNLTLKSVMMLQWTQSFCPSVDHVMKTDDDVYVNLDNLLPHLARSMGDRRRWIQGCIKRHVGAPVKFVDGKAVGPVDERTLPKAHPDFVAGAGYVISGDLVPDLLAASANVRWMPVEDVFVTAKCAALAHVEPETDDRFSCGRGLREPCEMKHMFTGHQVDPQLMRTVWDAMLVGCR